MAKLSVGMSWVDLNFLGQPHAIATAVIHGGGASGLIDPGPTTCLETLETQLQRQGLGLDNVTHLLLTHIHLDHAASAGTIVARHPHVRVVVHERGAPHLADPTRLLASATRIYGDQMDRLWGEVLAVPDPHLITVADGDRIDVAGHSFEIAYTPGHASHHVSYFDRASGVAFVGDTAGVMIDGGFVLPPTPPPDIDLEAWRASVAAIERWHPSTLFLTHFGPVTAADVHLRILLEHLDMTAAWVKRSLGDPGSDEERSHRFATWLTQELRRSMEEAQLAPYALAAPFELLWAGLARYWRRHGLQ